LEYSIHYKTWNNIVYKNNSQVRTTVTNNIEIEHFEFEFKDIQMLSDTLLFANVQCEHMNVDGDCVIIPEPQ